MCNIYELKDLVSAQKYSEAAAYYDSPELKSRFTAWDCYFCARALSKVGRDLDAIELYNYYTRKFGENSIGASDRFDTLYCWSVYRTKIKNFDFNNADPELFKEAVDDILAKAAPEDKILRWRTIRTMVKAIDENKIGDISTNNLICEYLDKVDPRILSTEKGHIVDSQGIERTIASDMEDWYTLKAKALLKDKEYEKCIETCDRALSIFSTFTGDNGSWLIYRKSKSLMAIGKSDEAVALANSIIASGFTNWIIYKILMDYAMEHNDRENILRNAGFILRRQTDYSGCVGVLNDLADYLCQTEYGNEALLHRRLEMLLREEKGWPVRESPLDSNIPQEYYALGSGEIIRRLLPLWNEWSDIGKTFVTGCVSKILPSGKDGFVRADDGNSYHFSMRDVRCKRNLITEGVEVRFTITPSFDRKKGEMRDGATDIFKI